MRCLLIEDDSAFARVLSAALSDYGYIVDTVADGELGWEQSTQEDYGLILLDVVLPKLDGISLCKRLRTHGNRVPILMMTACGTNADIVAGLDAGADDYLVKPIDLSVLLARIRALIRRNSLAPLPELTWGNLTLNPLIYTATYAGVRLSLTPKEFALLELFLQRGQQVLSRRMILGHLWSVEDSPGEDAVKAHIKTLRYKLKNVGAPKDWIETVRGVGYRLNPDIAIFT